jgi:signal transduction histidine kinase
MDVSDEKVVKTGQEAGIALVEFSNPAFRAFETSDEIRIRLHERDRLARELHDSTSQLLVILELQLMRLKQISLGLASKEFEDLLGDVGTTVAGLHHEVRILGNSGHASETLEDDLSAMATDFACRSGIAIETQIRSLPARTSPEVAHAIYRVAQEALANVSRHSNASNALLSLSSDADSITLSIADDGSGFPRTRRMHSGGQGIGNMTERLSEIGGNLTIENVENGALVVAKINLAAASPG